MQDSKSHLKAAQSMLGMAQEPIGAPPQSEFQDVLESLQAGGSLRGINSFKCSSDKTTLMVWCLQEAVLRNLRSHLEGAMTISLMRDARRQRLLIRYGVCSKDLVTHSGVLGIARNFGETSGDIVKATRSVIKRVCTAYSNPPRWYAGPESQLMSDLYDHCRFLGFN